MNSTIGERKPVSILFVCSANICRSPMAEALFRCLVEQHRPDITVRVESAGVWADNGHKASEGSMIAMKNRGLDISSHLSQVIDLRMLSSFDLILTMGKSHSDYLELEYPDVAHRVYLLSEVIGEDFDIEDPIGMSNDYYELTAGEIEDLLNWGFERILTLAEQNYTKYSQGT